MHQVPTPRCSHLNAHGNTLGKLANIEFAHGGRIWNTFDAHRLIQWGFKRGGSPLQSALKEECMHRYFEKSENVSAPEVLADIAVTAGIPKVRSQSCSCSVHPLFIPPACD